MYNLRYHIASLVAVFLALSVGLLLGTVVVERGVLSSQKDTLVEGLTKDFDALRAANGDLTGRVTALESFAGELTPGLLSGVLTGRTVVVLTDAGSKDTMESAVGAIQAAGGSPLVATFNGPGLGLGQPSARGAAAKALGVPDSSDVATGVVNALVREWTTVGDPRDVTRALENSGALRLESATDSFTVDAAVVVMSYDEKPDPASVSLAKELKAKGLAAVAVESSGRRSGLSEFASASGLSVVDDVDRSLGQVSLGWLLAGRTSGWFGSANGADAPYPTPLFPKQ